MVTNSKVLCFNYTEFIEDLYGVSHNKVCYIHGCRKKQKGHPKEKLILGHSPVWEYKGEAAPHRIDHLRTNGRGDLMDAAYEAASGYLIQYDQETAKDCAAIIHVHRAFFDSLTSIQNIVVIGHSLSPVDWDYFIEVNRRCPKAHWYISYYSANDAKKFKKLMKKLGIDSTRFSMFAT